MRLGVGLLVVGLLAGAVPSGAQETDRARSSGSAAIDRRTIDPTKSDLETTVRNASDLETTVLSASDLEATTRDLIAARWGVAGSSLVIEWGAYSGDEPDLEGGLALVGSGSSGYWVVRFRLKSGGPASVRARAGLLTPRSVASRRLQRGEILTAEDMAVSTSVVWGAPRPSSLEPSEGWIVQRIIKLGEPLRVPAVRPPMAVVSGSVVELIWSKGAVGLQLLGTAAGSAVLGDTVFVRTESGRRLRGVAVAPGIVNVTWGGIE